MPNRSGRFQEFLQKLITNHRKKRYKAIKQLSPSRALLRTIVIALECLIMREPIQWDYQYAKTQSAIERKLYNLLKSKGYRLKTQVPCGKYAIDIAIPRYQLAIEADGRAYHSSPYQKQHDNRKNRYLRQQGWSVLRFWGRDINGKPGHVLSRIEAKIQQRKRSA